MRDYRDEAGCKMNKSSAPKPWLHPARALLVPGMATCLQRVLAAPGLSDLDSDTSGMETQSSSADKVGFILTFLPDWKENNQQ